MRMTLSWRMWSRVPANASQDRAAVIRPNSAANPAQAAPLRVVMFMSSVPPVVQRSRARIVRSQAQVSADQQGRTLKPRSAGRVQEGKCPCSARVHFSDLNGDDDAKAHHFLAALTPKAP